ncbi:nucleoside hydrolase [Kribbella sp. NPDC051952]|uniref:nucleoside hydrolase n=1 Tax=Kribbella sp. NPDC051952 TaxID=3154851 RepID=UPI00341C320A
MNRIILDTDIGSDVDDAMALAQLMGTPGFDLVEVHTVYGDTRLRAQIARRYAALAGLEVDVVAGTAKPLSGREVWWAGHEGTSRRWRGGSGGSG